MTSLSSSKRKLGFLWLELTNRCNLQCIHCYTESHPHSGDRDLLSTNDYQSIMRQAYTLGCRKIQLIGGEPQLNRNFLRLLSYTKSIGFEFVEVFTNLTKLSDETIKFASANGICFATSVYSDDPSEHDAITKVRASHSHTMANLKRLVDSGVKVRAGIIVVNQRKESIERTKSLLLNLGVTQVGVAQSQAFGRGATLLSQRPQLSSLCGNCWDGKLCIAPDGIAYPCVMARHWPVGNVLKSSLQEIMQGELLGEMRGSIFEEVWLPRFASGRLDEDTTADAAVGTSPTI